MIFEQAEKNGGLGVLDGGRGQSSCDGNQLESTMTLELTLGAYIPMSAEEKWSSDAFQHTAVTTNTTMVFVTILT